MQHALEKVMAVYGDAWNSHDIEAILAMHTEDSVFENHTSGGKGVGKDAIRAIVNGVFATFPDIRFEARRAYVRDDIVVHVARKDVDVDSIGFLRAWGFAHVAV